jgi:hypothetical protein
LLEKGLETKQQQTANVGQALLGLPTLGQELGITGPTDLSINHDKYLYEED